MPCVSLPARVSRACVPSVLRLCLPCCCPTPHADLPKLTSAMPGTARLVHCLLGRVMQERPEFVLTAIAAVERGVGSHREMRLRIASIRTLGVIGALSRDGETQIRVLTVLCENLAKLLQAEGKGEHKGKLKKRFTLRGWRSKDGGDDFVNLSVALLRSIRATGLPPVQILQAACRVQDGVSVRHTLALMLDLIARERDAVVEALLQMLASEWHATSDVLASMYLSRLCAVILSGAAGTTASAKKVEALAEGRRREALQGGPDALFLHTLRTSSRPHTLLPGALPPPAFARSCRLSALCSRPSPSIAISALCSRF